MKKILIVLNQLLLNCKLFPAGNTRRPLTSFTPPRFPSAKRDGLQPLPQTGKRLPCPSLKYTGIDIKIQLKFGDGAAPANRLARSVRQPFPAFNGLSRGSGGMTNRDRIEAGTGFFITRNKKQYRSELYNIENIVQGNSNH